MGARFLAISLLATAALSPVLPAPPAAAIDSCLGRPATIVGSGIGTPGDDVMVVSGDTPVVDAGAGNDAICVMGNEAFNGVEIDAGPGDDAISVSDHTYVSAVLGPGTDYYFGGIGEDDVLAGSPEDSLRDHINTRAGDDVLVLDNGYVDAGLGTGRDLVEVRAAERGGGRIVLGRGRDVVTASDASLGRVRVDLDAEVLAIGHARYRLEKAETLSFTARNVFVRGDAADNQITASGCNVVMHGGAGNDLLSWARYSDVGNVHCQPRSRQYGEAGDDTLTGSQFPDVLLGGPGHDRATGGRGTDQCRAEQQASCER